MATTTFQPNTDLFAGITRLRQRLRGRGLYFGLILLAALVAFELFNFSTTEYALVTLFGEREALGVATWATVLAIAFCGIDFAGLSRLFTPETGRKEPKEIWLLTGAWFLGAGMNALMTWWAVGSALSANPALGNELVSRADMLHYGPIFIAALVWLTRILIIGTFAFAGDHIFSTAEGQAGAVVEGRARPIGRRGRSRFDLGRGNRRSAGRPAAPRAVPKPSTAGALPGRSQAVESSSYYAHSADSAEGRRCYDSQRSLFGRGAGDGHSGRPSGGGAGASRRTSLDRFSTPALASAAASTPTATAAATAAATGRSSYGPPDPPPARRSVDLDRFAFPAVASSVRESLPAGRAINTRASSTRTVSRPDRPAEPPGIFSGARGRRGSEAASSSGKSSAPEQTGRELEYVDLD